MKLSAVMLNAALLVGFSACASYPPLQVSAGDKSQATQQVREGIIELDAGQYP